MNSDINGVSVRTTGHPIFRILTAFPIACFSGALVTDIVYVLTADMIWSDFSDWLLAVGMVMAVLAAIAGISALVADRRWQRRVQPPFQTRRPILPVILGTLIVLALGLLDNLVHSRDAWTSVMPYGLALSAITVIVMLITAWLGSATIYRPVAPVAVAPYAGAPL